MGRRKKRGKKATPGDDFETEVDNNSSLLEARGQAFAGKVPTPIRITKHHKGTDTITGRLLRGRFVDFVGALDGGRFVAFECKSCEGTSFPFSALRDKKGNEHQRDYLAKVARFGGVAFVFVEHRKTEERFGSKMTIGVDRYVFPVDEEGVIARITERDSFPFEGGRNYDVEAAELYRLEHNQFWADKVDQLWDCWK